MKAPTTAGCRMLAVERPISLARREKRRRRAAKAIDTAIATEGIAVI